jgi:hypothetical protein
MIETGANAPQQQRTRSAIDRRKSIEWSRALLAAASEWVVLAEAVAGKRIVAYNADYDRRLLKQTALMSGGRAPQAPWECAMIAYSRFVGEWDSRKNDYRFQRLPSGDHSAAGDCRATLRLIELMADATG